MLERIYFKMKGNCFTMNIYPNAYLRDVQEITMEFLKENNLKALILDVDNTLIDYYKNLSEEKIQWARSLKKQGIVLYILSNTNKKYNLI